MVVGCVLLLIVFHVSDCCSQATAAENQEPLRRVAPASSDATAPSASQATTAITTPSPSPSANTLITIEPMVLFEEPYHPLPEEKPAQTGPATPQRAAGPDGVDRQRPRVAIIIDDMGYHQRLGEKLLALDLNLTFSFLPDAPFTPEQVQAAVYKDREVMIHLPMEPKDRRWFPGDGALYVNDSPETLRRKVQAMLAAIPQAEGVNNHMGSRLTEDEAAMAVVLQTLKEHAHFFIDSYTSPVSKGLATAERLGVPASRRDVFLDNVQEPRRICLRLEELAAVAKKRGWAIGIGHPYPATLQALNECGQQLLQSVDLVVAGQLVQ